MLKDCYGIILTIINFVNQCIILIITSYVLYLSGAALTTVNVHAGLCTVGYVLLMSKALLVLTEENIWSRQLSRRATHHVHWYLQLLGLAFSIAGVVVMFKTKEAHFKSTHAILGITSIAILCFLSLSGITVLFAVKLSTLVRPVIFKSVHSFLGIACFFLGMLAECYGYNKRWMVNTVGQGIANVCITCTGIVTFICIFRPLKSFYHQVKSILE
ncbi:uncharacterized protein [Chelonus insularis]|uniref:uncharacterized protein n=1 Tax=Chelonus insularis TaxID=460826 RepID=UPI00158C0156|nr:uncharacterized protein LOC118071746 [Chelonus insularis]